MSETTTTKTVNRSKTYTAAIKACVEVAKGLSDRIAEMGKRLRAAVIEYSKRNGGNPEAPTAGHIMAVSKDLREALEAAGYSENTARCYVTQARDVEGLRIRAERSDKGNARTPDGDDSEDGEESDDDGDTLEAVAVGKIKLVGIEALVKVLAGMQDREMIELFKALDSETRKIMADALAKVAA